jgi:hypothetical protein
MHAIHQLELLKALVRSYFSEELQYDESPQAAAKREELRKAIVDLSNN